MEVVRAQVWKGKVKEFEVQGGMEELVEECEDGNRAVSVWGRVVLETAFYGEVDP